MICVCGFAPDFAAAFAARICIEHVTIDDASLFVSAAARFVSELPRPIVAAVTGRQQMRGNDAPIQSQCSD
jgi:hypothetical protein